MTIHMQWALRRRMMMAALGSSIDISALSITYTGAHTDYGMVTMSDGARYRLLAFTSSGTLSIEQPVNCEVCVVGGGANGNHGTGGAGGYLKNQAIADYSSGAVVVGTAQGASSIGGVSVAAVSGESGGTGGGGHNDVWGPGSGDGISKYPFNDDAYELWQSKPHCAGGAGGGYFSANNGKYAGGNGGTNGGSGGGATKGFTNGGTGGVYGGGNGGQGSSYDQNSGSNATYYGSGGGGYGDGNGVNGSNGSGYQGIVYMRIPGEPAAYISNLPLGSLINVGTDGGNGAANYEIADINNLVPGGVVLVRKNVHSKSTFGISGIYSGDTLDNLIKTTIYNKMPQQLREKMMDVTFNLSGSGDITRKMFALTYTMVGFGNNNEVAEGKALQLYTSNNSRIKALNGSESSWRLSSIRSSYTWTVSTDGSAFGLVGPMPEIGVVPAFVIPSETRYDATPNTYGSYNLIL